MMGLGMVELTRRSRLPSPCGMVSAKQVTSASECREPACIVWSQFKAASIIPPGTMCPRRGCFVVAHDSEDARRIVAEKLTPSPFKSPWLDPSLTSVRQAPVEGNLPSYGWVGDIAGKWSA